MLPPQTSPQADEFIEQLTAQVWSDLDGILREDDETPVADAWGAALADATAGTRRGVALLLLTQAALLAYGWLTEGVPAPEANTALALPGEEAVCASLLRLVPSAASHWSGLQAQAQRLARYWSEAEPASPGLVIDLAGAIFDLYEGLRDEDHALSSRGLLQIRTMMVHIDALACSLAQDQPDRPVRVFAPDRFHDYFTRLVATTREPGDAPADRPVAALGRDGHLVALVISDDHPIEAAAEAVRAAVDGDPATKEHALFRLQGLLRLVEQLRTDARAPLAPSLDDDALFSALVLAAATTPMPAPGRFDPARLGQIAAYNLRLLRQPAPRLN